VLVPGQLLGRYDARIGARPGSALAAERRPVVDADRRAVRRRGEAALRQELGYVASAGLHDALGRISSWDFRHDGRPLPDTIVDLGAALVRHPGLRVLSLAGYHDVATPFRQTELDLARLGAQPTLFTRVYAGGHMTYLDDASRPRLKADIASFVSGAPMALRIDRRGQVARPAAAVPTPPSARNRLSQPALARAVRRSDRSALAQGGDPWVPPASRVRPSASSPHGAALAARVQAKIAERDRDVYR
jgi:hypothetical protein